jgi:hypothetical protein
MLKKTLLIAAASTLSLGIVSVYAGDIGKAQQYTAPSVNVSSESAITGFGPLGSHAKLHAEIVNYLGQHSSRTGKQAPKQVCQNCHAGGDTGKLKEAWGCDGIGW